MNLREARKIASDLDSRLIRDDDGNITGGDLYGLYTRDQLRQAFTRLDLGQQRNWDRDTFREDRRLAHVIWLACDRVLNFSAEEPDFVQPESTY